MANHKRDAKIGDLTAREIKFVDEYLIDLTVKDAALRAGYSPSFAADKAYQLLKRPPIIAAIQKAMDKRSQRTKIDADYVLTSIQETVERCKQAEPVLDQKGKPTGKYEFDASAVLRGCELLGKHLKLFADKVEHSGPNGGAIPVSVALEFVKPKASA